MLCFCYKTAVTSLSLRGGELVFFGPGSGMSQYSRLSEYKWQLCRGNQYSTSNAMHTFSSLLRKHASNYMLLLFNSFFYPVDLFYPISFLFCLQLLWCSEFCIMMNFLLWKALSPFPLPQRSHRRAAFIRPQLTYVFDGEPHISTHNIFP